AEGDAPGRGSAGQPAPDMGRKVANAVIARVAALDRYAAHFRTARALQRRITLVTGPTNSGKSYTALNALAQAESGLALAPLRLLAHEFREALASRGVEASLSTGEERLIVPGSRHLAATVEMCPFYSPVDVAVIDEAQMLFDTDRGAAWTAAIMGAPARHLYVLGAPDCIPMVRRIAELCGDPLDEISLERKSPLRAASQPVRLADLGAGDALIAFSRREVLDLRAALMQHGKRVAVVYGALSPEVRRAEAQRFNSGQADILVATDAIGMGLNLSIKRVVFASLKKYDGRQTRDLSVQEVKQIGGRAGRFGKHETGVVAVLAGAGSPSFVRRQLEADPEQPEDLRPFVQPDVDIVKAVATEIGSQSLYGVLSRIHRAVLRKDDPNYRLADMEQAFAIASALEGVDTLDLPTRWAYAMCPVDDRDNGIRRLVGWAADHAAGRRVLPPGTGRLPPAERA
ncbi:DEAD/DEAH box helicase, partial [Acetobacter peroxydans]